MIDLFRAPCTLALLALVALALVALPAGADPTAETPPSCDDFARWGREAVETMRHDFYLPRLHRFVDELKNGQRGGAAFTWGVGVEQSALNAAARLDKAYRPWLVEATDGLNVYWNTLGPVPGYDVLPCPKPVDRYYDDNAWLVIDLAETAEITGDERYWAQAERALTYVLSGEDRRRGGIFWRESDRAGRHTCATAPCIVSCYRLDRGRNGALRAKGDQLLSWLTTTLRDPEDGLMWDNVNNRGQIGQAKFSYNTALTIRALAFPGRSNADLERAVDMADAAVAKWQDPQTGALRDDACFAHLFCEALLALDKRLGRPKYQLAVGRALAFVHNHCRDARGHYGHRWEEAAKGEWNPARLIDQASAARGYLLMALEWME